MGTNAQAGIFLGWHFKSGCIWSGSYFVALKDDFEEERLKKSKNIKILQSERGDCVRK